MAAPAEHRRPPPAPTARTPGHPLQDLQRPGPPHPGRAGPRRRLRRQPRPAGQPRRIIRTGIAVAYLDRLSDCREPLQRAIQHGREGGAVTSAIEALFLLGQDAFHTGRWDEAQQLADEGLQLCDTHGYHLLAWPGRLTAALLAAARGDCQQAVDTARDMDAWAAPRRAGIVGAYAAHIRSLTALGQADFETAFRNAAAISPPGTFARTPRTPCG